MPFELPVVADSAASPVTAVILGMKHYETGKQPMQQRTQLWPWWGRPVRDIAYARQFRHPSQAPAASVAVEPSASGAVAACAVSPKHSLAADSDVWLALSSLGNSLQQSLCAAAAFSYKNQAAGARQGSVAARLHRQKATAGMSDKASKAMLRAEEQQQQQQSELLLTAQGPVVSRPMLQLVSASVTAAELLWSAFMNCLAQRLLSDEWTGILYIRRARYDETPLKVRSRAPVAGSELSPHAKVLQSELSFYVLVRCSRTEEHLLFFGSVPCPLKLLDRTTAEVTKAAVTADVANLEDAVLQDRFPWKLRVATVDRYGANLRCERSILHDSEGWSKYTKPCDLHLAAQVLLKTTALAERDVSGLLNTCLSQQGAGVLQELQQCFQEVLRERLVVYYEAPPAGRLQEHRQEVLDLFLPVDLQQPSRTVLLRRYMISALFNGNYAREDAVEHYCTYGCCRDYDTTVRRFATFGVWSMLCSKCPRFPRSRWTNQPQSVSWGGLMASVHNLLQAVIAKFTEPLAQQRKKAQQSRAGAEELFPALPDLEAANPPVADEGQRQAHMDEQAGADELNMDDVDGGEDLLGCHSHSR